MTPLKLWERFCRNHCACSELGFSLDISRMQFADGFFDEHADLAKRALEAMADLESGAIANPDEHRMVGHYWLRAPELAPKPEIRTSIEECVQRIKGFAEDIHNGRIAPPGGGHFENLLLIGIGGSALGPQFIDDALRSADDPLLFWSFDNTDPDGFDRTLARIGNALPRTLVLVISKSGGTKETRNGMLEAKHAYESAGLDFAKHVVAVTGEGSALYETAKAEGWIDTFPMWDWVGGRTSLTAAVGLLPAALQGFDIDALLDGARKMDTQTRTRTVRENPAMLMALMWYDAAKNRGRRDMVIIPYKDRLTLFSRYLQQLIMESIGKERDLDGNVVHEGIAVYGNKGSTDQHAYVQQLRDGLNNFHVTFVEVLRSRKGLSIEVEPGMTSGNFLHGFLQGTRAALAEGGRESMTITIDEVDAQSVGTLIALFERAVGFYASMTNINAYHQPGVEAGKKAAGEVLTLQMQVHNALRDSGQEMTSAEVAERIGATSRVEDIYLILRRFSAEASRGVSSTNTESPQDARFQFEN